MGGIATILAFLSVFIHLIYYKTSDVYDLCNRPLGDWNTIRSPNQMAQIIVFR